MAATTYEGTIDSRTSEVIGSEVVFGMGWLDIFAASLVKQATVDQLSAAKLRAVGAGSVFNWSWPARVDELGQATGGYTSPVVSVPLKH